jgi:hypothetical protein
MTWEEVARNVCMAVDLPCQRPPSRLSHRFQCPSSRVGINVRPLVFIEPARLQRRSKVARHARLLHRVASALIRARSASAPLLVFSGGVNARQRLSRSLYKPPCHSTSPRLPSPLLSKPPNLPATSSSSPSAPWITKTARGKVPPPMASARAPSTSQRRALYGTCATPSCYTCAFQGLGDVPRWPAGPSRADGDRPDASDIDHFWDHVMTEERNDPQWSPDNDDAGRRSSFGSARTASPPTTAMATRRPTTI